MIEIELTSITDRTETGCAFSFLMISFLSYIGATATLLHHG